VSAAPAISVAVSTRDRADRLERLLASLRAQELDGDFEVVVVDDASRDRTPAVLAAEERRGDLRLRTIRMPRSLGPAAARNAGWRATSGALVAFTDDDCVAEPRWLASLAAAAEANPGAIVQGTTSAAPDELDSAGLFSRTLEVSELGPYFQTCNIAYPRALLEELGGFDEGTFATPGGEDTDLAWRAIAAGAGAVLAADERVFHAVNHLGSLGSLRFPLRWSDTMAVFGRHAALRERLHRGIFWKRSHELLLRAAVGLAIARRFPPAAVLAYPYARDVVRRTRRSGSPATYAPFLAAQDAVELYATVRGAVKHRVLVL
jgi:glycosyltransferase involved in cell wall biosynthesis